FVFFFSSRRRHTRSYGDWSSDVCSSDLSRGLLIGRLRLAGHARDLARRPLRPRHPFPFRNAADLAPQSSNVLSVNGVATPDLEAFCREVSRLCEAHIADQVRLEVSTNGTSRQLVIGDGRQHKVGGSPGRST